MEQSDEPLKDLIAGRLLAKAEHETKTNQSEPVGEREEDPPTAIATADPQALRTDFVKIEKNLASLGFFTPSSKRIKGEKAKIISFTRILDGKKIEGTGTIAPTAIYGLPITADQDKYLALQKIVTDLHKQQGTVSNPIGFTSAELLRLLHKYQDSGKNYKDVEEWLDVMASTTIISEGAVYFAGRRVWAKDRFHVFDRAVSLGEQLEPGKIADKNYVWFSEWQLENINNNHQLPIDLETYQQLKTHIAKALVPLLQIWLYASRDQGSFEKRYDELCQMLNIRQYQHPSKIKEKLGPALNELKTHRYLDEWQIKETSDGKAYKIVFHHGEKFHRDRQRRLVQKEASPLSKDGISETNSREEPSSSVAVTASALDTPRAEQGIDPALLAEFTKRGVARDQAIERLKKAIPGQPILDQLEYGDYVINQAPPGKFHNPPGFYVYLVKANVPIPPDFETSEKKRRREQAAQERNREAAAKISLELAYDHYKKAEMDRYIAANYDADQFQRLVDRKKEELLQGQYSRMFKGWTDEIFAAFAERGVRADLAQWVPFMNFETFCEQHRNQPQQLSLPDDTGASPATFAV